jgi:MFS family permease
MPGLPESLSVLRERGFRLLFWGQGISLLGDGMVNVALAFAVLGLGGSASELGLVLAARMLPLVGLLLAGGVVADRLPRRAVMVAADLVRFASQGAMAALLIAGVAEIWMLGALAAVTGAASGFFNPASTGLLPAVVSAERLAQANALRGVTKAAGDIAGPVIAGVLVATAGAGWAMAIDAATFLVSAAFLSRLRLPEPEALPVSSFMADMRVGWDVFRSLTWVWVFVLSAAIGNVLAGAWNVLGPVVAQHELGGAAGWAAAVAAFGAGSLAGGVLALHVDPPRPMLVVTLALLPYTIPLALLAVHAQLAPLAAAAFVAGAGLMLSNTLWETAIQRHVPPESLSRVSAYDWFGSMALQPVGLALWGPVSAAVGTTTALWVAFALGTASVVVLLCVRDIRTLPRIPRPVTVKGDTPVTLGSGNARS